MSTPETEYSTEELDSFQKDLFEKKDQKGSLIPLLQSAQDCYGYIPEKVIYSISQLTNIPAAEIYGVITFYSQFRLRPMGKNIIRVCEGTACHVNGAKSILSTMQDELEISVGDTTKDGIFSLVSVACLGCCSLAPVIMINNETHGNLTSDKLKKIFRQYKSSEKHNEN